MFDNMTEQLYTIMHFDMNDGIQYPTLRRFQEKFGEEQFVQ